MYMHQHVLCRTHTLSSLWTMDDYIIIIIKYTLDYLTDPIIILKIKKKLKN